MRATAKIGEMSLVQRARVGGIMRWSGHGGRHRVFNSKMECCYEQCQGCEC
jgi:hypothetical protein